MEISGHESKYKRKRLLLFLIPGVLMCLLLLNMVYSSRTPVILLREDSYFNDFEVEGDQVRIDCKLTLQNSSNQDCRFVIRASSPKDVGTLLKEKELYVYDSNGEERVFVLPAKSKEQYVDVLFTGIYGGILQKQDRNLPDEIRIYLVSG